MSPESPPRSDSVGSKHPERWPGRYRWRGFPEEAGRYGDCFVGGMAQTRAFTLVIVLAAAIAMACTARMEEAPGPVIADGAATVVTCHALLPACRPGY